jgi:hypothetical protein
MRKNNSFRKGWHHVQLAKDYFADYVKDNDKRSKGAVLAQRYATKLDWMVNDFITSPVVDEDAKKDFLQTLNDDHFFYEEVAAACIDLMPEHKKIILEIINRILLGEKLSVELKP